MKKSSQNYSIEQEYESLGGARGASGSGASEAPPATAYVNMADDSSPSVYKSMPEPDIITRPGPGPSLAAPFESVPSGSNSKTKEEKPANSYFSTMAKKKHPAARGGKDKYQPPTLSI